MAYQAPGYFQMDGSAYAASNCVLAACTDLIDRVTVGALRIPAPVLRKASGDTSGGVSYSQAAAVTYKVTSAKGRAVSLSPRYGLDRNKVVDLAAAGYPFGISILALITRYTTRRTGTFTGGHTVYVHSTRWIGGTGSPACACETNAKTTPHREFDVEDPGTSAGYLWWSADLLFRAAEARGGGLINVLTGRDTENVARTCVLGVAVHTQPSMTSAVVAIGNTQPGVGYQVNETVNGGPWKRADGGTSYGWHHLNRGFVRGAALK